MPILKSDKRRKRARGSSEDIDSPETQLGQEAGDTDLTRNRSPSSSLSSPNLSSSSKEQERLSTPPPRSALSRVPNIKYFRDQEIFVENIAELVPPLSWDLIQGTKMKWLSYNDPEEEYNDENPHTKFGMILIGELGTFLTLNNAENHFSPEKPEFSIQLVVEDASLGALKDLLSRRGEGYTVKNPLRIKVPESELLSDSFNSGDSFPDGFDGASTTDAYDRPILAASAFTVGDKVAVQAASEALIAEVAKTCPNPQCRLGIIKHSGCDHMTCRQCDYQFCLVCCANWTIIMRDGNDAHDESCRYHSSNISAQLEWDKDEVGIDIEPRAVEDSDDDEDSEEDDDMLSDEVL